MKIKLLITALSFIPAIKLAQAGSDMKDAGHAPTAVSTVAPMGADTTTHPLSSTLTRTANGMAPGPERAIMGGPQVVVYDGRSGQLVQALAPIIPLPKIADRLPTVSSLVKPPPPATTLEVAPPPETVPPPAILYKYEEKIH